MHCLKTVGVIKVKKKCFLYGCGCGKECKITSCYWNKCLSPVVSRLCLFLFLQNYLQEMSKMFFLYCFQRSWTICLLHQPKCVADIILQSFLLGLLRVQMPSKSFPICASLHSEGKHLRVCPLLTIISCEVQEVPAGHFIHMMWMHEREMTASIKRYISGHYTANPRNF